jgi:hypothetical protein
MTQAQRFMLFIDDAKRGHISLFTQACRAQGWDAKDRRIRLRVFGVAVSFPKGHFKTILDALREITNGEPLKREITSASQLDNREDVDQVKALCLFLAGDLTGAQEMDNHEGSARRTRHVVVTERLRCLALYPLEEPMGMAGAHALLEKLLRDFVNKGRKFETVTLEDLSDEPQFYRRKGSSDLHEGPSQLQRVIMRLDGLLNTNKKPNGPQGYRVKAGHSLHDMKIAAGVRCDCSPCCKKRRGALTSPIPALPSGTDESAETVEFLEVQDRQ